ncbi:peptidoglycan transglycosylase [Gallibacterium salpingitidis]|uniref:Biosynthetic peptidoglycan transglycosylase n=1 Tax=Gallibacterium salpingitidis TaxID=505341 RepID=A0A1A7Q031_9PAST|nr:monofunctional biosynthetic peptidoglycan transglycosylase [Gallibacterium salpingitidis]OBW96236.1 peptidoglycan transglycosylase [Gallibacterium salpingitidis]OBX07624.1 peptidoglycan transglycosylase [Gallibacterium salpingitidis]OBX08170.1 peptidoglycan transglycosylase [Gallibacterium salpingitidis]WKS98852.1 monofunctional biosynthetic peptidoglycan transglycosylase [Gallibacterium salpingitidis]
MLKINKLFSQRCRLRLAKLLVMLIAGFFCCVILLRFLPIPYSTYMLQKTVTNIFNTNYHTQHKWVSMDQISPAMQLAVLAAEDQRFPDHWGFDIDAIEKAFKHNQSSKRTRGASTISQQTAKNLFLWSGRSWIRKGLEVPITLSLELFWSKRRILEVYLNIAEFGPGIFGVEAASQYYFKKSAAKLTRYQAALLAAVLPNPILYRVNRPSAYVQSRQNWILRQMQLLGSNYLNQLN